MEDAEGVGVGGTKGGKVCGVKSLEKDSVAAAGERAECVVKWVERA